MQLARAAEMQNLDRAASQNFGIPGMVLMENAGRGTVDCMVRELGPPAGHLVPIFVGPGNNGGDGLVIARLVHQLGGRPFILFLSAPDRLHGDAGRNAAIVRALDLPCRIIPDKNTLETAVAELLNLARSHPVWSLVDALFGTGMQRPLAGHFLNAVDCINILHNQYRWPVTAIDLPSGLDADTGQALGGCVRADLTITYGLAKPGHFLQGSGATGRLQVVDIGIPPAAVRKAALKGEALDAAVLKTLAAREAASHKGNYGHLLLLAGAKGKTGAAILAARAALRMGTGLVTLGVPTDLNPIFEASLLEAMTVPLPRSTACLSIHDYELIREQLPGKTALVIGPGLGQHPDTRELVLKLYREVALPMVVDADALNILALHPEALIAPPAARVLTPHPGEMARLTDLSSREIQADRLGAALRYVAALNQAGEQVTLVLKGAGTLVCDPDGAWAINTTGNPGMAAGGMGDVLAGMLGALLAQGMPPGTAARLGVYLHGLAADRLAQHQQFGYLASEVADLLPTVVSEQRPEE